ncbi:hypothetical protein V8G54_035831 [Vigna mungo]|uniref:Uncharacterized protein n=1 Tax=Vigna mungo TaxID=3915 RepID=A0AAQ3MG10_VIGMU
MASVIRRPEAIANEVNLLYIVLLSHALFFPRKLFSPPLRHRLRRRVAAAAIQLVLLLLPSNTLHCLPIAASSFHSSSSSSSQGINKAGSFLKDVFLNVLRN